MKFEIAKCPKCGEYPSSTSETIAGNAILSEPDENGEQDWIGDTDVCWDSQTTNRNEKGEVELNCENLHSWFSKEITDDAGSSNHAG